MELKYKGKTKDVYSLGSNEVLLKFKDDVTGENGVFDPGANSVGLTIEGVGRSGLRMTKHFFELLKTKEVPSHYVSADLDDVSMVVREAVPFGKGLEVICRFRAVGSFYRRYGAYLEQGQRLNSLVEITIKDDERGDPTISKDTLSELNVLTEAEYEALKQLTKTICGYIKEELATKGLELYDIKLEFGRDKETNDIILIDEISGGNMRVYKGDQYIEPLVLEKEFFKA
ncbi:phosphoribosylaminoimidazolesuccinocarboxamide synthase [Myroides pelagicus]|uniref:phosphoribosylaminoimidazolesuccinocarboxamide synthase n=1 Tax=Myroides pelagicus TaxID=270914 RepID=UPI002DB8D114|nr:phosphoribosylaminoimidazolesuccinocarboxamide synthase [Myroides pelagicus]MEC4113450.1 phosphoribosylaminoimidazolesuccinocarboxamide synthase [Myroides pelagicus]